MPVTELDRRVAVAQNLLIPQAEKAGRCRTAAHRAAITKLIREVQTAPSTKNLTELAEWTTPRTSFAGALWLV
jgi:hypothetical protein